MQRLNGKVSPEVMQTIQLDEIAGRLADLTRLLEREEPSGDLVSGVVSITDVPLEVNIGEWVRVTLFNNSGGSNVYIYNTRMPADTNDAYLAGGESISQNNSRQTRKRFYLVCAAAGTATVRWFKS